MKFKSAVLIVFLLYYLFGCYNIKILKDRDEVRKTLESGREIYVKTKSKKTYYYKANSYQFVNDTLIGHGQKLIWEEKQEPDSIKISVANIEQVKYQETDRVGSIIGFAIVGSVVGLAIYFLAVAPALEDMNLNMRK
jgi:hypothetical protein